MRYVKTDDSGFGAEPQIYTTQTISAVQRLCARIRLSTLELCGSAPLREEIMEDV